MDTVDAIDFAILMLHKNNMCQCEGCQSRRIGAIAGLVDARAYSLQIAALKRTNAKLREQVADLEGWIDGAANQGVFS